MKINKSQFVGKIENVIKHNKRACCKEKTNELRSNDSEVCELTACPFVLELDYADMKNKAGLTLHLLNIDYRIQLKFFLDHQQ